MFSLPRSAALNVSNALAYIKPRDTAREEAMSRMPPWLALTAVMVDEDQRCHFPSRWAPYLAVLPRKLDSLIFWSEPELAELQASAVVNKIGRINAEKMFAEHIAPMEDYDVDEYHHVASIIMAYAFDVLDESAANETEQGEGDDDLVEDDGEDEKTILSMVPLADMFNADADRNNARLCSDSERLEMRTIRAITKGEEIFNDYGPLPRSDLVRRYGYITDNYAAYDVAELSTQSIVSCLSNESINLDDGTTLSPLSEQEIARRISLADREGVYEDSYDVARSGSNVPAIPDELVALLFILLLNDENLEALASSKSSLPSRSKLSTKLVGQALAVLLYQRGREYETTLEEDEQLLQGAELSHRATMAVKIRMGEKLVLRKAAEEASNFEGDNKRMRPLEQLHSENSKRKAEEMPGPKKKGRRA